MKARIPCTKEQRKCIEQEVVVCAKKEIEKQRNDIIRRVYKTMLVGLNEEFGFGHDRLLQAVKAMSKVAERADHDEVFWEHIDRLLIDHYKLPFTRDYTNNGKVVK